MEISQRIPLPQVVQKIYCLVYTMPPNLPGHVISNICDYARHLEQKNHRSNVGLSIKRAIETHFREHPPATWLYTLARPRYGPMGQLKTKLRPLLTAYFGTADNNILDTVALFLLNEYIHKKMTPNQRKAGTDYKQPENIRKELDLLDKKQLLAFHQLI